MGFVKTCRITGRFQALFVLGLFVFIVLSGCAESDVITVGTTHITKKDLEYRKTLVEASNLPREESRLNSAVQLINGAIGIEIMKGYGYKFDNETLEKEAKRIDETTKTPANVDKIKNVFGSDRGAYLKDFVAIVYAERTLYNEIYLKKDEVHKDRMAKAVDFVKVAEKDPVNFEKIAVERGMTFNKLKLSAKNGITFLDHGNKKANSPSDIEAARKMIESLEGTPKGGLSKNIVDWSFGYQAIRFSGKSGSDYVVESAIVKKMPFIDWFWDSASKIPVVINDKALKDELNAKFDLMKKLKQ